MLITLFIAILYEETSIAFENKIKSNKYNNRVSNRELKLQHVLPSKKFVKTKIIHDFGVQIMCLSNIVDPCNNYSINRN